MFAFAVLACKLLDTNWPDSGNTSELLKRSLESKDRAVGHRSTRLPADYSEDLGRWIEVGSSPRASLALDKVGRTHAWLAGRDYVDPEDVRAIAHDVLRHRMTLTYEAAGEGITPDRVVDEIVMQVART